MRQWRLRSFDVIHRRHIVANSAGALKKKLIDVKDYQHSHSIVSIGSGENSFIFQVLNHAVDIHELLVNSDQQLHRHMYSLVQTLE